VRVGTVDAVPTPDADGAGDVPGRSAKAVPPTARATRSTTSARRCRKRRARSRRRRSARAACRGSVSGLAGVIVGSRCARLLQRV